MSNMEKLNAISQMIEGLKKTRHKEEIVVPHCESCGKRIKGTKWNKEYHHINNISIYTADIIGMWFCTK